MPHIETLGVRAQIAATRILRRAGYLHPAGGPDWHRLRARGGGAHRVTSTLLSAWRTGVPATPAHVARLVRQLRKLLTKP
jgi:hypothetical protein